MIDFWYVLMSIFAYTYLPYVYLLWWGICGDLLLPVLIGLFAFLIVDMTDFE